MTRRRLMTRTLASGAAAIVGYPTVSRRLSGNRTQAAGPDVGGPKVAGLKRRFTLDLSWGAIGVRASQTEAIELASRHGFESVYADPGFLAAQDEAALSDLKATMKQHHIVWGAAGLPVEFRRDEAAFQAGLKQLPAMARALQRAGVTRVSTWLKPFHEELTYVANFRQHARRLRQCVKILGDHNQRFGMEYVGPKTLWSSQRHTFIHTMAETKDLIAEIGEDNVGLVLDSWHWYTAHETVTDLKTLTNNDIVACDLNDAPAGIEIDQQIDNQRHLPSATGVIDLKSFLNVLTDIGYDGPVRAEPFNAALNALDNDQACAATAAAMRQAFSLVENQQQKT
ncbi:MAG: sugar phosphate isomerase/epimerase family protein [Fuerstiella sp.]